MSDEEIIDLYWSRSGEAITETEKKYGKYCHYIAYNILHNEEDSEECVNDTYMRAWNAIPPNRPNELSTFLGKIVRNLSLDKYEKRITKKRWSGQVPVILDELQECIPAQNNTEQVIDDIFLLEILNKFLSELPKQTRKIFVRRYWYLSTIKEIADEYRISESKIKTTLFRTRNCLKQVLKKEGCIIG